MNSASLNRRFAVQDEVMERHLTTSEFARSAYQLISDVTDVNMRILEKAQFQPEEKQDAVVTLAIESLSPAIVAVRVALWGNMPESLTVLRSGLESCAQLQFVIQERQYETAVYEMNRKFDRLGFQSASSGLGKLGEKINTLHGLISEAAAHATANRLKWNKYQHQGQSYFRVGFARDPAKAELPLFYCMDVAVIVMDALRQAYEQDELPFEWSRDFENLMERHRTLKTEFSARFRSVGGGT